MAKAAKSTKGMRRTFGAEFKQEAVRRIAERRAQGVSVEQIGRELDVRPEQFEQQLRQMARAA